MAKPNTESIDLDAGRRLTVTREPERITLAVDGQWREELSLDQAWRLLDALEDLSTRP